MTNAITITVNGHTEDVNPAIALSYEDVVRLSQLKGGPFTITVSAEGVPTRTLAQGASPILPVDKMVFDVAGNSHV